MRRVIITLIIGTATLGAWTAPVVAQVGWMSPLDKPGVSLEASKLVRDWDEDLRFWSVQYSLSARVRLYKGWQMLLELPYVHLNTTYHWTYWSPCSGMWQEDYRLDESTVGNALLGIEYAPQSRHWVGRVSVRFPMTDGTKHTAAQYGWLSAMDRSESFYDNYTTLFYQMGVRLARPGHYRALGLVGAVLEFYHSKYYYNYTDLSVEVWSDAKPINVGVGYHARYNRDRGDFGFDARLEHQVALSVLGNVGRVRPGVHFRFPLDTDVRKSIKMTYGLNLTVDFSR